MRLPLAVPIKSRDGTLDKGSKLVNVYTESAAGRAYVFSRPGISSASNSLVGYGNGIFGPARLSSVNASTRLADVNTVYTLVGETFAKTFQTNNITGFGSVEVSSIGPGALPFYFKNQYLLQTGSTIATRNTPVSTEKWTVCTSSAAIQTFLNNRVYARAFEYRGTMHLWKPYGETGGGDDPWMAWNSTANCNNWSSINTSQAFIFYSGTQQDFYTIVPAGDWVFWMHLPTGHVVRNSTSITTFTTATSSNWITSYSPTPSFSSFATGREHVVTDGSYFYVAVDNSSFSVPVPYGTTSGTWMSTWAVRNANCGFGDTSSSALGYYKGTFVLANGNSSRSIWTSKDFVNWSQADVTVSNWVTTYFNDAAHAMLRETVSSNNSFLRFFNSYGAGFASTQTTIGTLSNPHNVPLDMIYGK